MMTIHHPSECNVCNNTAYIRIISCIRVTWAPILKILANVLSNNRQHRQHRQQLKKHATKTETETHAIHRIYAYAYAYICNYDVLAMHNLLN